MVCYRLMGRTSNQHQRETGAQPIITPRSRAKNAQNTNTNAEKSNDVANGSISGQGVTARGNPTGRGVPCAPVVGGDGGCIIDAASELFQLPEDGVRGRMIAKLKSMNRIKTKSTRTRPSTWSPSNRSNRRRRTRTRVKPTRPKFNHAHCQNAFSSHVCPLT